MLHVATAKHFTVIFSTEPRRGIPRRSWAAQVHGMLLPPRSRLPRRSPLAGLGTPL